MRQGDEVETGRSSERAGLSISCSGLRSACRKAIAAEVKPSATAARSAVSSSGRIQRQNHLASRA